jgi:hypothetical protein
MYRNLVGVGVVDTRGTGVYFEADGVTACVAGGVVGGAT